MIKNLADSLLEKAKINLCEEDDVSAVLFSVNENLEYMPQLIDMSREDFKENLTSIMCDEAKTCNALIFIRIVNLVTDERGKDDDVVQEVLVCSIYNDEGITLKTVYYEKGPEGYCFADTGWELADDSMTLPNPFRMNKIQIHEEINKLLG